MKKILLLLIIILSLFEGCIYTSRYRPSAYISSLTDLQYAPVKTDPIIILKGKNTSISNRQFYSLLKSEMMNNGFDIVEDISKSKYVLLFEKSTNTSEINSTQYLPSTSYTSGSAGGTYYSGQTTYTQAIPYSYDYTVEKIYLNLYASADLQNKKQLTVWEGYVGVSAKEYKSYSRAIIKSLLDVFGTNYEAHTPINKYYITK